MGRLALMYRNQRQRWFARKIAPRQPLVARMARHQRLLYELMPTAGESAGLATNLLPERSFNWARQKAWPLAGPMFKLLLRGEEEEEPVLSSVPSPVPDRLPVGQDEEDLGQEATFELTAANTMDHTEIGPSSVPDKPEKVSGQQEVHVESVNQFLEFEGQELASTDRLPETQMSKPLEVQDQGLLLDQQMMERAAASDRSPEAPSTHRENTEQSSGINEPIEAKLQQEQKMADERARPVESTKIRRSRRWIEERPAEPAHTPHTLAAPPSPPSRVARQNEQEAAGKEASVANDLFAPQDTDRSPQAWMTRLMGTKSAPHDDVALPSVMVETEPGGVQTGSVAGEQPERSQQPADSDQFIPPVRQGRFIPTGEEVVTVTSQTDQGRKLKAGNQSLPAASANVAHDSSEARPVPTPLSQRARRLLRPLVGIDPDSVRVYQGAQAEQLADTYRADAIAVRDDVALGAGHLDDTPETLGLLAHEFTHVARQREPRFVPPIVLISSPASGASQLPLAGEIATGTISMPLDEETLAEQVERRVTRAVSVPRPTRNTWGGLPAPWEPLPDWLVSSSLTTEGSGHAAVVAPQPPQVAHGVSGAESGPSGVSEAYNTGGTWNGSGPSDTGVQRAGLERSLGEEEQTATPVQQAASDTAKAPEPDLDVLARQVYSLLKRRLEVERGGEG